MKKLFFLFTFFFPILVMADESGTCGESAAWTYTEATHTLTVSGQGAMNDYEWNFSGVDNRPWKKYGQDVHNVIIGDGITNIGNNAFSYFTNLHSITIPEGIGSIGIGTFRCCWKLQSIVIPRSVCSVGREAFQNCVNLTEITVEEGNPVFDSRDHCNSIIKTKENELVIGCKGSSIPNSVTSIGEYAFVDCSVTSLTIPDNVVSIGDYAFFGCSFLKSITFSTNLQTIGSTSFNYTGLRSVFIPKSVKDIGANLFGGSDSLTVIVVEDGNPVYDSRDNCNAIVRTADNYLLCGCNKTRIPKSVKTIGLNSFFDFKDFESIIIPDSVEYIYHSFFNCKKLTSIMIGRGIKGISSGAFGSCTVLSDVYCRAKQVPTTEDNAFFETSIENVTLHVPALAVDSYKSSQPWANFKKIVALSDDEYYSLWGAKRGDVTGDAKVDATDVMTLVNYILDKNPENSVLEEADVNGDTKVDIEDVTALIELVLKQ